MPNPILVEVTRGPLVESFHTGAVVVAGPSGATRLSLGDIARPVFPRSAIKLIQALPLIETGAADRFGFGDAEIALACGSHVGAERHVAVGRAMMAQLSLDEAALACGPAEPLGTGARRALAAKGCQPTAFHHNCSGKHAGMLAAALTMAAPITGYTEATHVVQQHVHQALADLTGDTLAADACGVDGCCVPTWALPLETLARLFAKIATGDGLNVGQRHSIAPITCTSQATRFVRVFATTRWAACIAP